MPIEWMQLTLSQSIFDFCRLSLTFLKLSNINKFVLRILWHMCSSDKCFDDAGRNVCLLRVGIKRLKKQIFNFVRLRHTSTLGCYSSLSLFFTHTLHKNHQALFRFYLPFRNFESDRFELWPCDIYIFNIPWFCEGFFVNCLIFQDVYRECNVLDLFNFK